MWDDWAKIMGLDSMWVYNFNYIVALVLLKLSYFSYELMMMFRGLCQELLDNKRIFFFRQALVLTLSVWGKQLIIRKRTITHKNVS